MATAVYFTGPSERAKKFESHGMKSTPRKATTIATTMASRSALSGRADCRSTAMATMNSVVVAADCALRTGSPALQGDPVAGQGADRRDHPRRHGEQQDAPEEARPEPLGVGHEGEEEAGDPDGQRADERQVPGQEGEGNREQARDQRDDHGVERLGQEHVGHPLDVAQHPAALGHHARASRTNWLSSSTSCATARVAPEPDPMAMPRSAFLSASTSLTPSPVIATVELRAMQRRRPSPASGSGVTRPKTLDAGHDLGELVGVRRAGRARRPGPPRRARPPGGRSRPPWLHCHRR